MGTKVAIEHQVSFDDVLNFTLSEADLSVPSFMSPFHMNHLACRDDDDDDDDAPSLWVPADAHFYCLSAFKRHICRCLPCVR